MANLNTSRLKFFVGLNTGYVTNSVPDERFIEFYRERSSIDLHCAIIGNVVVPRGFASNGSTPILDDRPVWKDVASCISDRGSTPGIQLATAWDGYVGSRKFRSPTADQTISRSKEVVRRLGVDGARSVLTSLQEASAIAAAAGFRHIQVHAAHGYLFSLLIDSRISPYANETMHGLAQLAHRWKEAGLETSIRISLKTGDDNFDQEGATDFLDQVSSLPFDFIDISSGFYNIDKQLIYPSRPDVITDRRLETIRLAERFPNKQYIYSGRALRHSPSNLPPNLHIGICRDLLANPNYLQDQLNGCVNSGKCHYFSRGTTHITCSQWPTALAS